MVKKLNRTNVYKIVLHKPYVYWRSNKISAHIAIDYFTERAQKLFVLDLYTLGHGHVTKWILDKTTAVNF